VFSVVGAILCTRQTVMMMDSTTSVHQVDWVPWRWTNTYNIGRLVDFNQFWHAYSAC
jgi:hypothetical protein